MSSTTFTFDSYAMPFYMKEKFKDFRGLSLEITMFRSHHSRTTRIGFICQYIISFPRFNPNFDRVDSLTSGQSCDF
jgi:hypothetical protein